MQMTPYRLCKTLSIVILTALFSFQFAACKKPKEENNTAFTYRCEKDFTIEPANYNSDSVSVFCPNIIIPDKFGFAVNNRFYFFATGITGIDYSIYQNGKIVYTSQDIYEGWNSIINGDTAYGKFSYLAVMNTIRNETITVKGSFMSKPSPDPLYSCHECQFSDQIIPGIGFVHPTKSVAPCGD